MQANDVVWLAKQEGGCSAYGEALKILDKEGRDFQSVKTGNLFYHSGFLQKGDGSLIQISLLPLSSQNITTARKLIESASTILLTGTCYGRKGYVKLGDLIAVTGCYHIDKGAKRHMDGSVTYEAKVVSAQKDIQSLFLNIVVKHETPPSVPIATRRDWVLDYLKNAEKPIPLKELYPIGADPHANDLLKNKQWKKTVIFLRDMGMISIQNVVAELTEKGKEYCNSQKLESLAIPSLDCTIHSGNIVTSCAAHGDLTPEMWKKFETADFSPVIGLDQETYELLRDFPHLISLKTVKGFGAQDKGEALHTPSIKAALQLLKA